MGGQNRGAHERRHVPGIRGPFLSPAADAGEARLPQAALGHVRSGKLPRRPAHQLGKRLVRHVDHLADPGDVPLAAALDLEPPARTQRRRQHPPHPLVVGDPVQTAFDTTTSTGSASSSDATSWHQTSARFPNRARASSTIAGEASKASTRPCGTSSTSCAVTRPVPHPTSTTVASAATPVSRPRTSAAHACCGWLETSYVRASQRVVIDMK